MIKHLLIDLDGTLTDPKVGITTSARYGLAKIGHPLPESENIDWIIGPPLKASLAKILQVEPNDVLDKIISIIRSDKNAFSIPYF